MADESNKKPKTSSSPNGRTFPNGNTTVAGVFGQRIKMEYGTKIKHNTEYLPDGNLGICIVGASGTGKSTVLLELIPQIASLSQIAICSLVENNPVYSAIKAYCEEKDISFAVLNDPTTAKEYIEEEMIAKIPPNTNGLIIFDDFSQQKSGRNEPFNQCASQCSALLRNFGMHFAFITQSATNVPTLLRNNTNVRIMFRMYDQHAIRSIKGDFVASGLIKPEEFDQLLGTVREVEHSYLMLVTKSGKNDRLYIYLPKDKNSKPMPVVVVRMPNIESDSTIASYVRQIKAMKDNADRYSRLQKRRMIQALSEYTKYLAKTSRVSEEEIADEIVRIHGVDV